MKQVIVKQGQIIVEEIPAPAVEPGAVLVNVEYSCISVGTEMGGLKATAEPLITRGIRNPRKVLKAVKMVLTDGFAKTKAVIEEAFIAGNPTGYSNAGTVIDVGDGVTDFLPGDIVACAGAQCAHHAEVVRVPKNLAVRVPEGVSAADASTVTLGAIAMQGVRRAQPTLGETFVVLGLGVLGQMTAQMLRANGCRVIGVDLDPKRIKLALDLGMDLGVDPQAGPDIQQVTRLTDGIGADGVIITAATPSHEVVSTAFKMTRRKGRVVLVGDVGLNLNRADFYQKEIDFLISTSYGPGRYDAQYEERGLEYPVAYVRWTENRNMSEYLRMIQEKKIVLDPLMGPPFKIEQAAEAYEHIKSGKDRSLIVLLSYPGADAPGRLSTSLPNPKAKASGGGKVRLGLIGAGSFAKGMHLPNIQSLGELFHLQAVCDIVGVNASNTAKQYGAAFSATDYREVIASPDVDAVLVTTRHNLHGQIVLEALEAGKHAMVEKPTAVSREELDKILAFFKAKGEDSAPVLLTGFNRRFSVFARKIHELTKDRSNPMIVNYRMNAGHIPLNHWVHTEEGGGRNIGEGCHIYDIFVYLTGSLPAVVEASCITPKTGFYSHRDNFTATVKFEDGSVCSLTYTALGSTEFPKERMEVYCDGALYFMDDYKALTIHGAKAEGISLPAIDKGHKDEIETFAGSILKGGGWPIPLWQQAAAMDIAFRVEERLGGKP